MRPWIYIHKKTLTTKGNNHIASLYFREVSDQNAYFSYRGALFTLAGARVGVAGSTTDTS